MEMSSSYNCSSYSVFHLAIPHWVGIDRLHKMDVPKDIEAKSNSRMVAMFQQLKWQNLVAGVSGGVLATFILHPLDLIKIRLQGKQIL